MCVSRCGSAPFTCSLYSAAPSAVTAADGSLVPERYVTRKSDLFDSSDSDPDVNCTPQGIDKVSCPAPGRLFDKMEPSENSNATRHMFHLWQSTGSGGYVDLELVFCWPVTITAMTWYFRQDDYVDAPRSPEEWSVTAVAENGSSISQSIGGEGQSAGSRYPVQIDNISGFPAARHWRIVIPLLQTQWLFLSEISITGKVERIGECNYRQGNADMLHCLEGAAYSRAMFANAAVTTGVILCML